MSTEISIANLTNFEKIQNIFNDEKAYREILENSENFNSRLCIERRLRMPFLDPQTGVAQNHCALFMKAGQRLPGFREGQIYTYPSKRWQKPKRQYLLHHQSYKAYQFREKTYLQHFSGENSVNTASNDSNSLGTSGDNDSKDSHGIPEKEWFYDELEMSHVDDFEEDFESDMDFDESYSKKKRRGRIPKKAPVERGEGTPKRGRGGGRGRRKLAAQAIENDRRRSSSINPSPSSTSTAPTTSTNIVSPLNSIEELPLPPIPATPPVMMEPPPPSHHLPTHIPPHHQPSSHFQHYQFPLHHSQPPQIPAFPIPNNPYLPNQPPPPPVIIPPHMPLEDASACIGPPPPPVTVASTSTTLISSPTKSSMSTLNHAKIRTNEHRDKADPSPYCDFCLGDARENRKTNIPEELVSCADCGRSGHPTCLQFTPNMIISVKRYRWQCIECKYCSICGTSDNDDQLLFCDDCDRGYHMYCLSPPLTTPPEGSWSCKLCLEEFHTPRK